VERIQNLRAKGDDGKVTTFTSRARLADLDNVIVGRQLLAQTREAIKFLVLEVKHRIGIANRSFDKALGVVSRRRLDDLQTRGVGKERFRIKGMKRPRAHAGTARSAKDCRNVRAPTVAALGRIVGEHVKAT